MAIVVAMEWMDMPGDENGHYSKCRYIAYIKNLCHVHVDFD